MRFPRAGPWIVLALLLAVAAIIGMSNSLTSADTGPDHAAITNLDALPAPHSGPWEVAATSGWCGGTDTAPSLQPAIVEHWRGDIAQPAQLSAATQNNSVPRPTKAIAYLDADGAAIKQWGIPLLA